MGAWGHGPLDNDSAADWCGDLMEDTGFRDAVARGLDSGDPDAIRAAAWLIGQICEVYVWPIDHYDADRILAGQRLYELLQDRDWLERWGDQAKVKASLRKQIKALGLDAEELEQAKSRANAAAAPAAPREKKTTKKKATKKASKKKAKKKTVAKKTTKKKTVAKKATKGWTRLTYEDAKSSKFWQIKVSGSSHTVRYGRIGTDGQEKTKSFDSPAAARAAADKLEAQKRKKGYA